jgi:PAS domain S-box-containing protein
MMAWKKFFASIQMKLVFLALAIVVPFILLITYNNIRMYQISSESAKLQSQEQAYIASQELESDIKNSGHLLVSVVEEPDIVTSTSKCQVLSALLLFREPSISNLIVFKPDGSVTCSGTPVNIPDGIANKDWFNSALKGQPTDFVPFQRDWKLDEPISLVVEPHKNVDDVVDGVVVILINQDWVKRTRSLVDLPENSTISIIAPDGTVQFRDPNFAEFFGKNVGDVFVEALTPSGNKGSFSAKGLDGTDRIYGFVELDPQFSGNYILVGVPKASALAAVNQLNLQNLIMETIVIALAGILSIFFSKRQIVSIINRLVDSSKKMAKGDLTIRTGLTEMDGELGFLGQIFDQTANTMQKHEEDRQVALDQLEQERQYFETLVNSNPIATAVLVNNQEIKTLNPAFTRLFGYDLPDLKGKNLDLILNTEATLEEGRSLTDGVIKGNSVRKISRRKRKDGSLVDVEIIGVPILVDGKQVGHIGLYHDITDLIEAKQAAEASVRAKADFLANMSHEIRTPLNAVIGMTNLLMDTHLDNTQQEFVDTVRTSGEDLLTIINDILDFSKIEAGKLDLENMPFDVSDCVESALQLMAPKASEKGLEMLYLLDPDTPLSLLGDVTRLRQILVNLLGNAIKFTERGEILTTVEAHKESDGLYEIHFAVTDTGIGIAPESYGRIFKSFSQADSSTTRRFGGSGLGLSISKKLAETMGGRMWFESVYGKGTTFHFTIKAKTVNDLSKKIVADGLSISQGKTILIVDDNERNRMILSRQLESWKINPLPASSGFQALEILSRLTNIDAAILDMQMPEMDGAMLAKAIRKLPGKKKLPLILLTSFGRREPPEISQLFVSQLSKPVRPSILYENLLGIFANQPVIVRENSHLISDFDRKMSEKHPLRILLADDNVVNQKVATRMLERLGYRIDLAGNGLEVLQSLERQPYDLVFMDVQMPEMDGLEASRQIQKRIPADRKPRIIAMTAHALQGDRERFLAEGMDDYLCKPVQIGELVRALKNTNPLTSEDRSKKSSDKSSQESIRWKTFDQYYRVMGEEADSFITDLIHTYLPNARKLIEELKNSSGVNDLETFNRAAHTLKSSSASLGVMKISEAAKNLEYESKDSMPVDAIKRIKNIEVELKKVSLQFGQFLSRNSSKRIV